MDINLTSLVSVIVSRELSEVPFEVCRMTTGACNEVYSAELSQGCVIVRMNREDIYLRGSDRNIPLFQSLGISVPKLLASDYSKTVVPVCYQIQSRLKGTDLGNVIGSLSKQEVRSIAESVVEIFHKLRPVATNGRFGYVYGDDSACRDSWSDVVADMIADVESRNSSTSLVDAELLQVARDIFRIYVPYFNSVASTFFYDDISSKNVLIDDGRFTGLVDLDGVAYGDPLEAVGRIKASWFGTRHGHQYLSGIEKGLNLTSYERRIVSAYALLHRIYWLSEKGFEWNLNTSNAIDPEAVQRDKAVIADLRTETGLGDC